MKIILLDTNFLIDCAKFKIDFFTEIDRICTFPYGLSVLDTTVKELDNVNPPSLKLIKTYLNKVPILKAEKEYVDDELIRLSKDGCIIATQDQELKQSLKKPIIVIRQEKYLALKE